MTNLGKTYIAGAAGELDIVFLPDFIYTMS